MSSSSEVLLAHGIGGRQDLPIPFSFALVGAVVALARLVRGARRAVAQPATGRSARRGGPAARAAARRRCTGDAVDLAATRARGCDVRDRGRPVRTRSRVESDCSCGLRPALGRHRAGLVARRTSVAVGEPAAHGAPPDCCRAAYAAYGGAAIASVLGWAGGRRLPVCWHSPGWSWQLPTGRRCRCCAPGSRSTPE